MSTASQKGNLPIIIITNYMQVIQPKMAEIPSLKKNHISYMEKLNFSRNALTLQNRFLNLFR